MQEEERILGMSKEEWKKTIETLQNKVLPEVEKSVEETAKKFLKLAKMIKEARQKKKIEEVFSEAGIPIVKPKETRISEITGLETY